VAAHAASPVPFRASASLSHCLSTLAYDWDFGDGSPHGAGANVAHQYPAAGDYTWTLTVTAAGVSPPADKATVTGIVTISPTLGPLLPLTISASDFMLRLSWPLDRIPVSLETSPDSTQPNSWQPVSDPPVIGQSNVSVQVFMLPGPQYFRLRRVP
jgi:PKD repeat protein